MTPEQKIIDLMNRDDLSEEEILAQLASHPDQEAVAAVTGSILSLLVPIQNKEQAD